MIAPDANLLIYAYDAASPFHRASRSWIEGLLSSSEAVGIPVLSIHAFLRFGTDARIVPTPRTFARAAEIVNSWLALPHVHILHPGDRLGEPMKQTVSRVLRSELLSDASPGPRLSSETQDPDD